MKNAIRISLIFMIVIGFVLSGNAYALRFTGNAWLAHHYSNGVPTDEYFLVIDKPGVSKARLKGFKFEHSGVKRNFANLIGNNVTFWQISCLNFC